MNMLFERKLALPMEVKEMAEYMLDYFAGAHTSNTTYMSLKLEELTDKIKPMLNRYSLEETLVSCENTLASAKGEDSAEYPSDAVVAFENELNFLFASNVPDSTAIIAEKSVLISLAQVIFTSNSADFPSGIDESAGVTR